jgi:hypothetical protein
MFPHIDIYQNCTTIHCTRFQPITDMHSPPKYFYLQAYFADGVTLLIAPALNALPVGILQERKNLVI